MAGRLWDPFNDGADAPILRNKLGVTAVEKLSNAEFASIGIRMPRALVALRISKLNFDAWKKTHGILFGAIYPWAGTIRHVDVVKGPVRFNFKENVEQETSQVFAAAEDLDWFRAHLGQTYGELAFNHPFLDGNGRSLNTVFSEMARRAGFGIAWDKVIKRTYLAHLTNATLGTDYQGLDEYLNTLKVPLDGYDAATSLTSASAPDEPQSDFKC